MRPFLVLDEATSALDFGEFGGGDPGNLHELMGATTVITPSPTGFPHCPDGPPSGRWTEPAIIEAGTHAELLARGGLYADLWARQSGGFIGVDEAAE